MQLYQLGQPLLALGGGEKKFNRAFQNKILADLKGFGRCWWIWKAVERHDDEEEGGEAGQFNGCPSIWKNCRLRLSPLVSLGDKVRQCRYRQKRSFLIGRWRESSDLIGRWKGRAQRKLLLIGRKCPLPRSDWSTLPPTLSHNDYYAGFIFGLI